MHRQFIWVPLLLTLATSTAVAQRVEAPLWSAAAAPVVAPLPPLRLVGSATRDLRLANTLAPTHWKEGGIVGAILVGLAGAAVAGGLCGSSETNQGGCTGSTAGGLVVGGLTGFGLGALIGGQFRKRS